MESLKRRDHDHQTSLNIGRTRAVQPVPFSSAGLKGVLRRKNSICVTEEKNGLFRIPRLEDVMIAHFFLLDPPVDRENAFQFFHYQAADTIGSRFVKGIRILFTQGNQEIELLGTPSINKIKNLVLDI